MFSYEAEWNNNFINFQIQRANTHYSQSSLLSHINNFTQVSQLPTCSSISHFSKDLRTCFFFFFSDFLFLFPFFSFLSMLHARPTSNHIVFDGRQTFILWCVWICSVLKVRNNRSLLALKIIHLIMTWSLTISYHAFNQ